MNKEKRLWKHCHTQALIFEALTALVWITGILFIALRTGVTI